MANQGKNITGINCFICNGISLKATTISLKVFNKIFPFFLEDSSSFNSSLLGGYSEVVNTVIKIVIIEAAAPIPKAQ